MKLYGVISLAAALCLASLSGSAQILVGHRGSLWGLENSKASFTNGAMAGYCALECDIRTTKDGEFIISHDEDLVRLGADSSAVIAKRTAKELLGMPLHQTRKDGKMYEGHCITLREYFEICKQFRSIPVVEIKWSRNIYSNNNHPEQHCYDGIPALMSLVDEMGLSNRVIFLTSMKGVLEYIRAHYPMIDLQLLSRQNWRQHVDWCRTHKISIDVEAGGNGDTKELVDTFHDMNLKVNVWTIDDNAKRKELKAAGVDMITTNMLLEE